MTGREEYTTGPAHGARVEKRDGDKWTLVLTRDLRHPPAKVWDALIDPTQLREWAPYEVDGPLGKAGVTVQLTWVGTRTTVPATVTRAEAPTILEYGDMRWHLEPHASGTRLTLWASIDRRYIAWGAAGWHISFDVLGHLLSGTPIGRIGGGDATKLAAWKRLITEYGREFGIEPHH